MKVVDSPQGKGVRRRFNDAGAAAGVDHLAQHALERRCLRRRPRRRHLATADLVADGADSPARHPRRLEDRSEQVRRRRLAVGASDANENEIVARVAVERRRQCGECQPGVGYLHPRHRGPGRRRDLRDDGDRSSRQGIVDERGPVRLQTSQRDEDRATCHFARIARHRRHRRSRGVIAERHAPLRVKWRAPGGRPQEITERHWDAPADGPARAERRPSVRTHAVPGTSTVPAAGDCSSTNPAPFGRLVMARLVSTRVASRALIPTRFGISPSSTRVRSTLVFDPSLTTGTIGGASSLTPCATSTGGGAFTVGAMPRWRSDASATRLKIGAATAPPMYPLPCGESMTTIIASSGLRDGTKPTNDALYSDGE